PSWVALQRRLAAHCRCEMVCRFPRGLASMRHKNLFRRFLFEDLYYPVGGGRKMFTQLGVRKVEKVSAVHAKNASGIQRLPFADCRKLVPGDEGRRGASVGHVDNLHTGPRAPLLDDGPTAGKRFVIRMRRKDECRSCKFTRCYFAGSKMKQTQAQQPDHSFLMVRHFHSLSNTNSYTPMRS